MKKLINGIIINIYNRIIGMDCLKRNRFTRRIKEILYHNICWRCEASFGKNNPERLFYVIRSNQAEMGFFGLFNYVVDGIWDAIELGAEPIVDWKYYPNDYISDENSIGRINSWDLFFEPICDVSIDEVYKSKNVIMSGGKYVNGGRLGREYNNPQEFEKTSELIKKYIHVNKEVKNMIIDEKNRLGLNGKRILGVKCRGTDFKESKPYAHSICPDVNYTSEIIDEKEIEWGRFDNIFLVTEDEQMYNQMKHIYKDRLVSAKTNRITTTNGKWLNSLYSEESLEYKKQAIVDYIVSVYILSDCNAIIAPIVGATNGAMRIRGRYDHSYIINLGRYD